MKLLKKKNYTVSLQEKKRPTQCQTVLHNQSEDVESSSQANQDRKEIILYLFGSVEQHLINLKAAVL